MELHLYHLSVPQFSQGVGIIVAILHIRKLRFRLGGLSQIALQVGDGLYLIYVVQLTHRLQGKTEATSKSPASGVTQHLFESIFQTTGE